MIGLYVFLVVAALVVTIAVLTWQAEQRRRAALMAFARSKGWSYSARDTLGLSGRWGSHPFGRGHSRRASNVLFGTERGRPIVSFDYQYTETDSDSDGKSSNRTYHFHVTAVNLPCYFPTIEVGPENALTRIGNKLGLQDIELESEDFNRRFRVRCPDVKFAHDVLHPRTMQFLLGTGSPSWRVEGGDLVLWDSGRMSANDVLRHLHVATGVLDGIPSFVWKDHGYDPAPNSTPGGAQ